MKIKLLIDLPTGSEHGMTAGRILEVIRKQRGSDRKGVPSWFVQGDIGEEIGVLPREAEVVEEAA